MPALQLVHQGHAVSCALEKIDRSKLYGYIDTEVLDESQRPCRLATLASDGRTMMPPGGVAFAYVSPNGLWRDKSQLKAVDAEGQPIEPVGSTFKEEVILEETASAEDLLDHNIRMSYLLSPAGEDAGFPGSLSEALAAGTIYRISFSYRGGLSADTGFIMQGNDGATWLLVGKPTAVKMVGFEEIGGADEEGDADSEDGGEDLDFGMM